MSIPVHKANEILDDLFGNNPAVTRYLALFTSVDGLDTNAPTAEVSAASYARQAINFDDADAKQVVHPVAIVFPEAQESWGTITHAAVMTAATGGSVLWWLPLDNAKTIDAGDIWQTKANEFTFSIV